MDQQWLEQCALDPDCGPHWPGGLVRTWQAVLQSIQNNSNACVAVNWPWLGGRQGADRLRVALKMVSASWWGRPLAPAVVWRLDRCSPQDVAELDAWMATNGLDSSEAAAAPVNVTIAGLIGPWGHVRGAGRGGHALLAWAWAGWLGGWVAGWLGGWVAGWLGGWVAGWLGGRVLPASPSC